MYVFNDVCADEVRLVADKATVQIHMHAALAGRDIRATGDARVHLVIGDERRFEPDGNHAAQWIVGEELVAALDSMGNDLMQVYIDKIRDKACAAAAEQKADAPPATDRHFEL